VHATLYRIVGTNQGIDDMLQDVFVTVFRSLAQYRGEAKLSTWIDRCAVHIAYRQLRSGKRARLELVSDAQLDGSPSIEHRTVQREAVRRLYAILDRLETKQRVAYALHVLEGRPLAEVAELTQATVVATKVRVWRARQVVESRARHDPLLREYVSEAKSTPEAEP
jgi:RNA polymerase sigma factor (sigma-70 family)